jgi:predicted DNA-binding transcriptional regulator AlpA
LHPREYEKLTSGKITPPNDVTERRAAPKLTGGVSARGPPDDDVLLTSLQTRARHGGVSAMCIWRWMRDPRVQFPAPIKINARNYWRLGDLRRWHAERIAKAETSTGEE